MDILRAIESVLFRDGDLSDFSLILAAGLVLIGIIVSLA